MHRIQRAFSRAAATYDDAAHVQRQVVLDLLAKLPGNFSPGMILDIGCGTGFALRQMTERYPETRLVGIDFSENMLSRVMPSEHLQKIVGNATFLPVTAACADLAFSSLTYQWCSLETALSEARRVLRPAGTLAFSTLTGDTFQELREAFAGIDEAPHTLPLRSEQSIRDTAVDRFSDIAVSRTRYVSRFASARHLFDSIRMTGAQEVAPPELRGSQEGNRRRGLLGKSAFALIQSRLKAMADTQGLLPLTYDVLFVTGRRKGEAL